MKNISYEDAVSLLLNIEDEYRDYCEMKNGNVIGGEVGKGIILDNLLRNKDKLQIPESKYFTQFYSICLGITYIENYDDNRNQRMFIPVDYEKLKYYIESKNGI